MLGDRRVHALDSLDALGDPERLQARAGPSITQTS
jgi:hypothetical protein